MNNISLAIFQGNKVRKCWHKDQWYFVVVDIIQALTETPNPTDYLKKIRKRDHELQKGWGQIVTPLKIITKGGKQVLNCTDTEGAFRLVQSIPSKKAEPFKLWLAKVGYERIKEIEDPELAQRRMKELYRAKGYSEQWIEKRVRGIAVRDELTDQWRQRGVKEGVEFSILTSEISKATFDMTPKEYKEHKGLKGQNLRDHMNDLELIFTMLGEKVSTEITKTRDAQELEECSEAAKEGGEVAGNARKDTEKRLGKKITNKDNYLKEPEKKKRLEYV